MAIISLGSMAFDAIETPFGKVDKIVGGSGTYVAYAAAHLTQPIQQISIVGNDFPEDEMNELKKRGVQLTGVEIVPMEPVTAGQFSTCMRTAGATGFDACDQAELDRAINASEVQLAERAEQGDVIVRRMPQRERTHHRFVVLETAAALKAGFLMAEGGGQAHRQRAVDAVITAGHQRRIAAAGLR